MSGIIHVLVASLILFTSTMTIISETRDDSPNDDSQSDTNEISRVKRQNQQPYFYKAPDCFNTSSALKLTDQRLMEGPKSLIAEANNHGAAFDYKNFPPTVYLAFSYDIYRLECEEVMVEHISGTKCYSGQASPSRRLDNNEYVYVNANRVIVPQPDQVPCPKNPHEPP